MKKRYAQVGVGGRARMFYKAVADTYKDSCEMVAFCDINQTRMNYANKILSEELGAKPVPTYSVDKFDDMIREQKPDVVIVTSVDRTHHKYIIRAMELGCDVITEKPMTVNEEKCQAILDAQKRTGREIRVTFNYRYAPLHTKCREVLEDGAIGEIFSVHFEWLLDTHHGADYFRRWHRDKRNSGGLLVHKSTHHFDLVNFWIQSQPKTVFAFGDLNFYGRENAEKRGITKFYNRSTNNPMAEGDPFAIQLTEGDLKNLYYDAEHEDGYIRDLSVFSDGISIEDTMGVIVKYKSGAVLTYSLNAYMPYEGYKIAFNGSKGRLEMTNIEIPYINAGGTVDGASEESSIRVFPLSGEPYDVPYEVGVGSHGGGDAVLLDDIFLDNPPADRFHRAASHVDGAMSILTGIAANQSIRTGKAVDIDSLVKF